MFNFIRNLFSSDSQPDVDAVKAFYKDAHNSAHMAESQRLLNLPRDSGGLDHHTVSHMILMKFGDQISATADRRAEAATIKRFRITETTLKEILKN